jgi:ribonucleotide reductase alpha subunit
MGKVSKKEEETFIKHNESVYRTFESDDFEVLWKVIRAKDYFYQLANLQLNTKDPRLSKSQWISEAINSLTTKFNQA